MKKLVQLRRKKPESIRINAHRYKRLDDNWRKPKGKDARDKITHKANPPKIGRSMPRKFRGLHPSGLKEVLVKNVSDLDKVKEGYGIRIAHVGKKKKMQIIAEAKKRNIPILNLRVKSNESSK